MVDDNSQFDVIETEDGHRELEILLSDDLIEELTEKRGATWSFEDGLAGLDIDSLYVGSASIYNNLREE